MSSPIQAFSALGFLGSYVRSPCVIFIWGLLVFLSIITDTHFKNQVQVGHSLPIRESGLQGYRVGSLKTTATQTFTAPGQWTLLVLDGTESWLLFFKGWFQERLWSVPSFFAADKCQSSVCS